MSIVLIHNKTTTENIDQQEVVMLTIILYFTTTTMKQTKNNFMLRNDLLTAKLIGMQKFKTPDQLRSYAKHWQEVYSKLNRKDYDVTVAEYKANVSA